MAVGRICWPSTSTYHLCSPLIALWDTKIQRCTSDPACELWDEAMLLGTREREREVAADRMARAAARPGPAMRLAPLPPAPPELLGLGLFGRGAGLFPPAPEPPRPEPPRPAPQLFNPVIGGDFDWIDDSSAYARFTMAITILISVQTNQVLLASATRSPAR